jgi:DNA adenine methylase
MISPFPYFGGKRSVAADVWQRLGEPMQYIEPFCGSAAVLLAAPRIAPLEVVCDASGFIANFWRAVKHQSAAVAEWADYPVSHIDLGARHVWLMAQRESIGAGLHDPDWPGDAKVAGWWLWGQCCWIGSGWCEWDGKVPHAGNAGRGVQAIGQVPHASSAGMGVQAIGQVPHAGNAGRGVLLTSAGRTAMRWLTQLADRLERVRVVHGDWTRCLNNHFGGDDTAVFLDPPYRAYERLYGSGSPVADAVEAWARDNAHLRIALCGHRGDYDLAGWDAVEWSRGRLTYSGNKTTDSECVWYSPACLPAIKVQPDLFIERPAPPKQEAFL